MKIISKATSALLGAVLCCLAGIASAAPVRKTPIVTDPNDRVLARILASFNVHANAARRWYVDTLEGRRVNTEEFSSFSRPLETATFVSFTYEYRQNGQLRRRIYHARSGRNNPWTGVSGLVGQRSYSSYFSVSTAHFVAWDRSPRPSTSVTSSPVAGDRSTVARQRDAELKVARQVERDILNGTIAAGGRLNGYSSQIPCPSCEAALQALSDTRGITVHVAYLGHGSSAYRRFHNLRQQYTGSIHVAANGGQLNLLNQEEVASDVTPLPVPCLDAVGDGEVDDS
jgi:hypothetical protein